MTVAVAVAHGLTDMYQGFFPPLLPRLMAKLGLSITMAAGAAMVLSLAGSVVQPGMGILADRHGRRVFILAGPLLSGVFVSLVGLAPGLGILLLLLIAGGLGSAAFHPPGASMAVRLEAGRGSGLRYSIFSFGGALGYALGPVFAVAMVSWRGLEGSWAAMVPALLLAPAMALALPADRVRPERHAAGRSSGARTRGATGLPPSGEILGLLRGPLGLLFGISATGAFIQRVFLTMEPIIAAEAGASEALGAAMLSTYLGAQALGTVAGGVLADRVDRRTLLATLTALAVPTHMLALGLPTGSWSGLGLAAASGFVNMALLPAIVVMAQEMVPGRTAVSSGIVMGLAWAAGSLAVVGTGALGDWIGPRPAALASVPALLLGTLMALHPALGPHRRATSR